MVGYKPSKGGKSKYKKSHNIHDVPMFHVNAPSQFDGFSSFSSRQDGESYVSPHQHSANNPFSNPNEHFPLSTTYSQSQCIRPPPFIFHRTSEMPTFESQSQHPTPIIRPPYVSGHNSTTVSSNQSHSHDVATLSKKVFIQPTTSGFIPNHVGVVRAISRIMQSKFEGPYTSWKKVPQDVQDLWFVEFQKAYTWNPEDHGKVKANFCEHAKNSLKSSFSEARKDPKKRFSWISQENWDKLFEHWNSKEFKDKCARNKKNRASESGVGSSLHTGGSIPIEEHARRMAEDAKGKISWDEVYKRTHQRRKDKSWVDDKASTCYEKYEKYKAEHVSSEGSIGNISGDVDNEVQQEKCEFQIWKEAIGVTKSGKLYGFGPIGTAQIKGSTSNSQKFLSWKEDPEFQEYLNSKLEEERSEKEELKRELDHYKKKTDKLGKMMKTLMNRVGGSFEDCFSDDDE